MHAAFHRFRRHAAWTVVCFAILSPLQAGPPERPLPSWPPPPAEARVNYVREITSPEDLGVRRGFWGRVWGSITGDPGVSEHLARPFGLSVDRFGNLAITDTELGLVGLFDAQKHSFRWMTHPDGEAFSSPVAAIREVERVFVADSAEGKILVLDLDGKLISEIKGPLVRPAGLAIANFDLYVTDSQLHQVHVFTFFGTHIATYGQRGAGPVEFNFPTHIAVDRDRNIYVNDTLNHRIQVLGPDGSFIRSWGRPGNNSGAFSRAKGMAFDSNQNLYIVDAMFGNIQVFDRDGNFLLPVGDHGEGPGEFWLPSGITIDPSDTIYVADSHNRRIQVLQYIKEAEGLP